MRVNGVDVVVRIAGCDLPFRMINVSSKYMNHIFRGLVAVLMALTSNFSMNRLGHNGSNRRSHSCFMCLFKIPTLEEGNMCF